jgi:Peptidase family M1 domain
MGAVCIEQPGKMFYRRIELTAVLAFAVASAYGQAATNSADPLSDRLVSYQIDAALDVDSRTVSGTERLTWRNPGSTPVQELQFHLYLNAFAPGSTFQVESGGEHRGFSDERSDRWGGIEVTRMQIASGLPPDLVSPVPYEGPAADLTGQMRFIQPDDDNRNDHTVMAVTLPRAVAPGETIALDIDFESDLPRIVARTGFAEDESGRPFFMVAQWFPKIAVFEVPGQRYVPEDSETGAWNAHQFHANSEFYADFGTFDVTMRVPESFVVGASGIQVSEDVSSGQKTLRYRAEDVHDFAWTAYEGYQVYEDSWRHVSLKLLLRPEHEAQAERHLEAAKIALDRYDAWVGEYPYTTLTVVDGIGGANGMEYPTLITAGTVYKMPDWVRPVELVIIHEFGHQYFYGLLASNEFEEAWLDEGMNSYIESRIMDDAFGPGSVIDLGGLKVGDRDFQRLGYTKNNPSRGALFTRSWEYKMGDYSKGSYTKPATVMNTLEAYLGSDTMQRFLKTYYSEWRFRHPTTQDLQDVAESVSGQDLDWFFQQYVYGTAVLDYELARLRSVKDQSRDDSLSAWYHHTVRVQRRSDGYMPTELKVTFEDGTSRQFDWDGQDEWYEFAFEGDSPLTEAWIDPDRKLWLETRLLNNRRTVDPDGRLGSQARGKFATRFQQLAILLSALF